MKKFLAALLSLASALTLLAACGKTAGTAVAGPSTADEVNTTDEAPVSAAPTTEGSSEPATGEEPTANDGEEPKAPQSTEEILAAYAAAVDKTLAANRQVSKHCRTVIKKPLEGDDAILKLLKISIAGFGVEKKVCELLGEGDATYNQPMVEALQKSSLRVDDVTSASATIDEKGAVSLTINIKNCTNPLKLDEGGSPLGRFTWDFANIKTVDNGIASAEKDVPGLKINIAKKTFNYTNIKITATISPDGVFTHLVHSFNYIGRVEDVEVKEVFVKLGGGKWGQGNAAGTITYNI